MIDHRIPYAVKAGSTPLGTQASTKVIRRCDAWLGPMYFLSILFPLCNMYMYVLSTLFRYIYILIYLVLFVLRSFLVMMPPYRCRYRNDGVFACDVVRMGCED